MKTPEEIYQILDEEMRQATKIISEGVWKYYLSESEKQSMKFNSLIAKDCE